MSHRRDPELNTGCANCANYIGNNPVNVVNFCCSAGENHLHVLICMKFKRKPPKTD